MRLLAAVVVIASAVTPKADNPCITDTDMLKSQLFADFLYHCVKTDPWVVDLCISEGCDMWDDCPSCFTHYAECYDIFCSDECASLPASKSCVDCLEDFGCYDGILSCTGLAKLPPLANKESNICVP
ncbi:hypothetical protein FOZ62_031242 [Perkinsus olseni]|uniref:Uncharacterized protein n=1 Tax=Perkinsus olseni TaxID=32597 RepID=A0A7J6U350_PEROL|nr:hypothetical protein FOZ62_031242 [Perkinsus olseni]